MARPNPTKLALVGGEAAVPPRIHRRWPELTEGDKQTLSELLDHDLWGIHGPEVTALEEEFAAFCGARYCLALSTGTAVVQTALVAAGVRPGDEVIVGAYGYIASAQAIALRGATPVFCDVDIRTGTLDVAKAAELITERTRAILAVHIHGLVVDMRPLEALARQRGRVLVCDAAQAAGATENGAMAGTFGLGSSFSLNGQKILTGPEGGLFTTDDDAAFLAAERFACLGEDRPHQLAPGYERGSAARFVGDQFRLTEFGGAYARLQLRRLPAYLARGRENAALLSKSLAELPGVEFAYQPPGTESAHYRPRVMLDPEAFGWSRSPSEFRDRFLYALRCEGVPADVWARYPLPAHPAMRRETLQPWRPGLEDGPLLPWHPYAYPATCHLVANSITLGTHPHPLHVQTENVIRAHLTAFTKVVEQVDVVMGAAYEPLRTDPYIPESEL